MLNLPSKDERERRNAVIATILQHIQSGSTIHLPPYDRSISVASRDVAGQTVGLEPNPFGGSVGSYRYQFEGEEDLLHVLITRLDQGELLPEDAQQVFAFLLPQLPPSLVWLKPGKYTQHFYFGHDELLASLDP